MSDFKNNNNHDSPVIEPFRELAASQDVAPKQEEQEPDNPETTGSLPQIPDYYHCYGPDQGHHIHGLEHEDATALHDGGGGGGDSSSPPAFPLMPLHIPVRSDPDELLAAVPGMNHHQDEHYIVHLQDQQQQQQQPQYLWHAGDSHYHHRQHQHHDTDGFAYGDTSSPSSPAVSWASSLSTLPDHLAHADDPWHGLSPTSPPELASPDADSLAASPEWHYEHVAASPLDDFVGMNVHAPRSPAPSPADCLPSMVTPYIPSEHHHYFLGSGGGAATVAGSVPDHVYLNEQGRSALASASLRAQMVNQSAASPNTTSSTAAAAAAAANADGPPYAQLIFCALMSRADRCMSLQEIYQWFRENTDKHRAGGKGWQNSIRHNLSMNRVSSLPLLPPPPFTPRIDRSLTGYMCTGLHQARAQGGRAERRRRGAAHRRGLGRAQALDRVDAPGLGRRARRPEHDALPRQQDVQQQEQQQQLPRAPPLLSRIALPLPGLLVLPL